MKFNSKIALFTIVLIIIATACKYFFGPDLDWSGFSPIIAIALFSGFIIRRKDLSFILPILALFISDVIIHLLFTQGMFDYSGFYSGQWLNYLILLSATATGWILKGNNYGKIFAGALVAPTLYFFLSNFSVWMGGVHTMYPKTVDGLIASLTAGLPFYRNAIAGTLVFLPVILLVYNLVMKNRTALKLETA